MEVTIRMMQLRMVLRMSLMMAWMARSMAMKIMGTRRGLTMTKISNSSIPRTMRMEMMITMRRIGLIVIGWGRRIKMTMHRNSMRKKKTSLMFP